MKKHQANYGKSDDWITPKYIIDALGGFDLDPCQTKGIATHTAATSWTVDDNALERQWHGRVWVNPPWMLRPLFMQKMAEHGSGIMLMPAAMETRAFKAYVFGRCSGILAMNHRPRFLRPDGSIPDVNCGCTICLVSYDKEGKYNLNALLNSGLGTLLFT